MNSQCQSSSAFKLHLSPIVSKSVTLNPMQKSIYIAKGLLILAYTLLYLLLLIFVSISFPEPLFQAIFHVAYLIFVLAFHDQLYAAFLQAIGSSRVDSSLRRLGGFAELIDKLHEYNELDDLLRYTQTSLSALMGGAAAKILLSEELVDSAQHQEGAAAVVLWGQHATGTLNGAEKLLHHAREMQQSFSRAECSGDIAQVFDALQAQIAVPVFRGRRLLALLMLHDPSGVYPELHSMLDFLSRQLGIALERIESEQKSRRRAESAFAAKSAALAALSATIAHEMRTPLSGVRASIGGVDSYLPELIEAYRNAHDRDPARFPVIRAELLDALSETGPRIKSMVDQANHVIDLLLANFNDQKADHASFVSLSVQASVEAALQQYPFQRNEREKVIVDSAQDFTAFGEPSLLLYVLFNLLKNALYSIESAGRGGIRIRLEREASCNVLIFEDTGLGIEASILPHIFDGFFTTRSNGTGAGLAFCRRTMRSFGGDISVRSELGVYTRFRLVFPTGESSVET